MTNLKKKNNGITLIALIITIIVMLILVGVVIVVATGENGLINKTKLAKEETEMAALKEKAEIIKANLIAEREKDGVALTNSSLVNAIYEELGQEKNGNIVLSQDGKYDIIVESNLDIRVERHGTSDKEEITDLVRVAKYDYINDDAQVIGFDLSVEAYYPELVTKAIVNTFNMISNMEPFEDMDDLKQMLISTEGSPWQGKTEAEVTEQSIIDFLVTSLTSSKKTTMTADEFMKNIGFFALIQTQEQKEEFVFNSILASYSILANFLGTDIQNLNSFKDMSYLEFKQYMINNIDNHKGKKPEDISFEEVMTSLSEILDLTLETDLNSAFASYQESVFEYFAAEEPDNEIILTLVPSCEAARKVIMPDLKVVKSEGKLIYGSIYLIDLNGTYTYTIQTNKYSHTESVEITNLPWSEVYEETKEYIDSNGKTAVIPKGFMVSKSETSNAIDNGLVIVDRNKNKFVWIPVSDEDYSEMVDESSKQGKLYDFSNTGEASYIGLEDVSEHQEEFDAMCASVKANKGFYIGVYETTALNDKAMSIEKTIINEGDMTLSFDDMYNIQKNLNTPSDAIVSGMIWGCQWDRVMKFVQTSEYNVGQITPEWHNVHVFSDDSVGRMESKNIYDLEGNYAEYTMEKNLRGGGFKSIFSNSKEGLYAASDRHEIVGDDNGSRMMLYIK